MHKSPTLDLRLGIEIAATGQLIGQVTLYRLDQQNRSCDVGYALGREYWDKGYLAEALAAMLGHGFAALNLNRVEADINLRNSASTRALDRCRRNLRHRVLWPAAARLASQILPLIAPLDRSTRALSASSELDGMTAACLLKYRYRLRYPGASA